jgi:hypothetical protein
MIFNPDRSVSIHFERPDNKTKYKLDISHDAEPIIRWNTHNTIRFEWRNPKGGQLTAGGLQVLDQMFGEHTAETSAEAQHPIGPVAETAPRQQ